MIPVLVLSALTLLAAPPPQEKKLIEKPGAKNLITNGDFEAGTDTPTGWQKVDGLTLAACRA
jgi:hypothetical protein